MEDPAEATEFLKQKFPHLSNSPEVKQAARRSFMQTGEQVPADPDARIQNYLDRFREIIERSDPTEKERGITALKKILVDRYVVRVEDIPDTYWKHQLDIVRSRGEAGDWEGMTEEEIMKKKLEHLSQTKEDQKGSFEEWIDYLASEKSAYLPDHLKYWVFSGVLQLERYEKGDPENGVPGRFPKRPSGKQRSVKMFPEVNERGLQFLAKAYGMKAGSDIIFGHDIPSQARGEFKEYLIKNDFRALYGWTQEYIPPITDEEMATINGIWVTYPQGSDAQALSKTLQGKGSGWCIAGQEMAKQYLKDGELNIYYSNSKQGTPTVPRVVIVNVGNKVREVRGIAAKQTPDHVVKTTDLIADKLKTIEGGTEWEPTDRDTKLLTDIDSKISSGTALSRDELIFLYEKDRPIKYFGEAKDPRIAELRSLRNLKGDAAIVLECQPEQIAWQPHEIQANTKAYVGPLFVGIADRLPESSEIYVSFPDGRIEREAFESLLIDGKTREELESQMDHQGVEIYPITRSMLKNQKFTTLLEPETIDLVRLTVANLGFNDYATTEQIFTRMKELGLDYVPAETGPHYRLAHMDQPDGEWIRMGMEPIADSDGDPLVFNVGRVGAERWFFHHWANSDDHWVADGTFVFRLRKLDS